MAELSTLGVPIAAGLAALADAQLAPLVARLAEELPPAPVVSINDETGAVVLNAASVGATAAESSKTAAQHAADNTMLLAGQRGRESDTGKEKVGDGVTAWSALGYTAAGVTSWDDLADTIPAAVAGTEEAFTTALKAAIDGVPDLLADKVGAAAVAGISDSVVDLNARVATAEADLDGATPLNPATAAEVRRGEPGLLFVTPDALAAAYAVNVLPAIAGGSYAIDGKNGPNQVAVASANTTIAGIVDAPMPTRFRIISDGPIEVKFAAGVTVLGTIPQEKAGEPGTIEMTDGQRLAFNIVRYDHAGSTNIDVSDVLVSGASAAAAPVLVSGGITPAYSATVTTLTASYSATGNPTPTAAYQWSRFGVPIPGATGASYTPGAGEVGAYSCAVTIANSGGSDSATFEANIGAPIPVVVGQSFLAGEASPSDGNVPIPAGAVAGDSIILIGIQANSVSTGWSAGFSVIGGGEIARIGTTNGSNYRVGLAIKTLTTDDIANGVIAAQPLRIYSTVQALVVRGLGSAEWDPTVFSRSATVNSENSRDLPPRAASAPGLAVAIVAHGHFEDETAPANASAIPGWTAGALPNIAVAAGSGAWGAANRCCARLHFREVPTGTIPPATATVGGAAKTITVTTLMLYGVAP